MIKQKLFSAWEWFLGRSLILKIIMVLVLFGLGWLAISRISASKAKKPQYQIAQAEKGTLVTSVTASGQVSSTNSTSVSTQASGVVSKVFVKNDQVVKVGDKIAELDLDLDGKLRSTQAWSSYLSAKNSLDSAKSTMYTLDSSMWVANRTFVNDALARGLLVYDPTYIQENDNWLAAEAKYINQKNAVDQAQINVSSSWLSYQQSSPTIYAPISGTVTGLSLQEGTVLVAQSNSSGGATSQKIASIKTDAAIQLSVNLTEMDVVKIKVGDKATVTLDAFPDKTYTGKVISIDTIGSISSGVTNYPAIIGLDTEAPEILPNMSVSATIITKVVNDVVLVPSSAVRTTNGQSTVSIMKGSQVTPVSVEVGDSNDTQTAILSGINEEDVVVTSVVTSTSTNSSSTSSPFGGLGGNRNFGEGAVRRIGD